MKPRTVSRVETYLPRMPGEDLGHEHGLGEEALDAARARHGQLVLFGQLLDAQDGDDVLQVLVALQHASARRGRRW